jgi:two-component system, cell cycle response regulator DivK
MTTLIRLLLVEDNPVNAKLMCRRLERHDYQIVVAVDGETAITIAQADPPHLILMDIGLPSLDGWETTRILRQHPVTATIPIIALTAHNSPEDRQQCLEVGCNDYAVKPVDFDHLLSQIQQWLMPC